MFKSNAIFHIIFMLAVEFLLCYGVAYGVMYLFAPPHNQEYVFTDEHHDNVMELLNKAGSEYHQAYYVLSEEKRYTFRRNIREMSIKYQYTEAEFNNYVHFVAWSLYLVSMIAFLIITGCVYSDGGMIAAPFLCKVLGYLLLLLPKVFFTDPIKSRKEYKWSKRSTIMTNFINYKGE